MKKIVLAIILFFSINLFAQEFDVDLAHSKVGFKIKHLMISNVVGYFNTFKGSYDYDKSTGVLKSFEGIVQVESIDTSIEKRDNHLRSSDFFDVKEFPKMTLVLTEFKDDYIYADLTIKNVTKKVKFEYENGGTILDPKGILRSAFSLEGKIDRKDFGLTWNKALEAGGVVVGDSVKINIEIEGISK